MSLNGLDPIIFESVSNVTATLGDRSPELGATRREGGIEYLYVYNAGGEQIDPGYACVPNSASAGFSVTVTAQTSADFVQGVVYHSTLTTDTYGWVATKGVVPIEMGATSGTVSARGLVEVGADGVFVPTSLTTGNKAPAVGIALAAIVSGASGNAYISC